MFPVRAYRVSSRAMLVLRRVTHTPRHRSFSPRYMPAQQPRRPARCPSAAKYRGTTKSRNVSRSGHSLQVTSPMIKRKSPRLLSTSNQVSCESNCVRDDSVLSKRPRAIDTRRDRTGRLRHLRRKVIAIAPNSSKIGIKNKGRGYVRCTGRRGRGEEFSAEILIFNPASVIPHLCDPTR